MEAPIVAVVEAKKEDLIAGLGQCVAEMVAIQMFNEREGTPMPAVYGCGDQRQPLAIPQAGGEVADHRPARVSLSANWRRSWGSSSSIARGEVRASPDV